MGAEENEPPKDGASASHWTDDNGVYLEVDNEGELLGWPEVKLEGGGEFVPLEKQLLRQAWDEDEIRFRVPDRASSGVLTVDCGQLAGQPLLRVSRPPTARVAVRMQAGTGRVHFDSRRSSDDTGDRLAAVDDRRPSPRR